MFMEPEENFAPQECCLGFDSTCYNWQWLETFLLASFGSSPSEF